ncbi:MAG TPA: transposase [Dongiaceae bacterium]|nr:transposase [Dongiaceae bacterium]
MSSRIEIVGRVSGRRRWTVEQKLTILRDAFGPEGCVRTACERHDVGSGSIYTWRRQAMSGELTGVRKPAEPAFAEVQISGHPTLLAPAASAPNGSPIGIELPSGIRVTVDATVDADALSRVIGVLTR